MLTCKSNVVVPICIWWLGLKYYSRFYQCLHSIVWHASFHLWPYHLVSYGFPKIRKLIGTRYFNKGYAAYAGHLNSSFQTARDSEGHGTHTLSTAAGNFVPGADVLGYGNGTAKGGSPHARAAAYKVCWPPINGSNECFDADILAAFDVAISDGVDVLSVSLGGDPAEFSDDAIAIGSFHAVAKGITVVASAGNSGPSPGTVSNVAPWLITVGASTMDRAFTIYVALGNRKHLKVFFFSFLTSTVFFSCTPFFMQH
jgi:hypothetical protein